MGRIKTTYIKRKTKEMHQLYSDKFTTDYIQNKVLVSKYATFASKKIKNIVAGYMTRLKKKED
tara:strand:+ start:165 stop:353 length:189 start_codon:yes stop_codon:yes gene_type:complete